MRMKFTCILTQTTIVNSILLGFLQLFLIASSSESTQESLYNIVGEVNPAQVEIAIGANTNITCRMIRSHFNKNNSSCLAFYEEYSNTPIPKEHISVKSENDIVLLMRNVPEQNTTYLCKCNDIQVGTTKVIAGTPRTTMTDFQCSVYDFEYMICSFTPPNDDIYNLELQSANIPGTIKSGKLIFLITIYNGYRPVIPNYNFVLKGSNSLKISFLVKQFSRVVPPKPIVQVENLSSNSVTLRWKITKHSNYIQAGGLHYEIRLHPYNEHWFAIDNSLVEMANQYFWINIKNLEFPYRQYNYSVRMITNKAFEAGNDDTWSEAFMGSFTTKSRKPDRAPKVDVGSYYIQPKNQTVWLFWEPLSESEENGPNFKYVITEMKENGQLITPSIVKMHTNSALISFPWNNTLHYEFQLKSQNEAGTSLNSSIFQIYPGVKESKQEIIKIYHQQNQTYTILWRQPENFNNLSNLTLFSCVAKTESKMDCMSGFKIQRLNKNTTSFTTSLPSNQPLNFALSENYHNCSTGMIWATCAPDNEPKLTNIILKETVTSDSTINLQWNTQCWYSTILTEFALTYCMTDSKNDEECISESKKLTISRMKRSHTITGLRPSSSYKIWFYMVSQDTDGPRSIFVLKTTPENGKIKRISIIVAFVTLIALGLYLALYIIKKRISKMRDIQYIIPEGLDIHIMKLKINTNSLLENTSGKDAIKEKEQETLLSEVSEIPGVQRKNSALEIKQYQLKLLQLQNSGNGYIKPTSMKNKFEETESENINIPENSTLNGYITPSSMAILKSATAVFVPSNNEAKNRTASTHIVNENISGYITSKQLFGMSERLKLFLFFLITICLVNSPVSAHDYVGEVIPHHVELPIGGSVNITCRMNRSYFNDNNSSCLSFTRDHGNVMVPREHIHVINDSSIVFMVRNATEQSVRYTCKCHDKGVYVTNIYVGTPPTNVTDFQCRGYDFSFMTCSFNVPENKIYTDYKLKFSTSSPDYIYPCTLENGLQSSERICNITMDKNNYRIVYQYYNFELTSNNSLGTLTQSIMIDQYSRIVPARPNVEIGSITTNSVTFYWIVSKFSQYSHTDGLHYEIRLRPDKFDWFYVNTNAVLQKNDKDYKAEIKNLQYSFRKYDVRVRVKTVRANKSDETMWSEPFEGFFYTKPRRPERAPNMDVGSFYIDPTEQNIRLYWQQLEEYEENGPDFQYNITEVRRDGKLINAMPTQMDSTSATYEWQRTSHYQFKVQSQNQVGKSLNTSILEVHPSRKRSLQIEQIQVITKVYHNQTYTITWRQPSDMNKLSNFTLFWCISKMESQSQCKGTINFKHFDKYTTNHTTAPQNHTLNFAVSANYDTYSTGMMWAMCTADGATDLTKMDPETTPISSNSIRVQWSTECLYMAILEGYNLTYCKVDNNVPEMIGSCIDIEKTISISKSAKEHIITGLEPFTTYKISILMFSKLKIGPMSNPVTETTTEDAPSAPRKLKKYNVTSNSVKLSWLPPKHSNGNLRSYTVWYKNESTSVNITSNDTESEINFELGDLSSYSDYKVYVTAHTVKSSVPSNDIHFKTLIGIPSIPLSFIMNRHDKELLLSWSPPELPSGRIEFYEVRVTVRKNNESETLKTSRVVGNTCKMKIPCYDPNNSYIFDVRAVNVADKSEVDYHTFSKRDTSHFSILHQGAAKRRRHSNAEINTSIGAPYQIHGTTEKHLRHRHERENLKLVQTTEPSFVAQLSTEIPDEIEDDSNEDFTCIGGEKETLKILRQYKDDSQYKLFHSDWQNGPFFACSETKFSKLTLFALVVIVVTMLLLATIYSARKKYNKMSSIGLVIPEGLEDNTHISKGVDNTIERDDIIRNDELFYDKENHRLLSKVGNDSGFLNSVQCLDKSSAYACSDHQDSEKSSQSTDSVELNDITSCSYTSSPSHSPNANIRESTIPEEKSATPVIQPSVQLRPSDNGYIKPIMMSNGYVQPQAFQQLQKREAPSFNGYTTLDAMGKPLFPQTSTTASAPIAADKSSYEIMEPKNAIPQPTNGNICGYVTHKQLSDFGQRLQ